jgi:hypothetical protein
VLATHGNGIYTSKIESVNDVISIGEFEKVYQLTVYPNPSSSSISINIIGESTLTIYDIQGKQVLFMQNVSADTKVDVSELQTGFYFAETNLGTVKWLKN